MFEKYGVRPYKDSATVQYNFDRNLAVWLQFGPKQLFSFCDNYSWQMINQKSSTAFDFEFPCKPLLGPSLELMQPQPSIRVVQGSIVRRQHMRGACGGWKWEILGRRGRSEAIFALAVPTWHRTVLRTVIYCLDGKVWSAKYANTPSFSKIRSVPSYSYCTFWPYLHNTDYNTMCCLFMLLMFKLLVHVQAASLCSSCYCCSCSRSYAVHVHCC